MFCDVQERSCTVTDVQIQMGKTIRTPTQITKGERNGTTETWEKVQMTGRLIRDNIPWTYFKNQKKNKMTKRTEKE